MVGNQFCSADKESSQINMLAEQIRTWTAPLILCKSKPTSISQPVSCVTAKRRQLRGVGRGPDPRGCTGVTTEEERTPDGMLGAPVWGVWLRFGVR